MQETEQSRCARCATPKKEEADACSLCGLSANLSLDPFLGQILFEKYQLQKRIGVGSYAVVFEAEHLLRKCKVAFKILHQQHVRHPELVARFRREAIAASRLVHPYALKVFDCGAEENVYWSAIELVNGETLDERLERGELYSPEELLVLFRPICEVLAEAHEKGVVHRDLKPANIILGKGPGVPPAKILDYGLARIEGTEDESNEKVSGTPRYMAPEQWKGLKHADARSDIYALGVIAYQCLSGKLPFDADTTIAWLKKHRNEAPLDLRAALGDKKIPDSMSETIMKALSKDPAERPRAASDFFAALQAKPKAATEAAPAAPSEPQQRGSAVWLGATSLVLASLALVLSTQQSLWARPVALPASLPATLAAPSPSTVAEQKPSEPLATPTPTTSAAPASTQTSTPQNKVTPNPTSTKQKPNKNNNTPIITPEEPDPPKEKEQAKPAELQMKTVDPWKL